MEYFKYTLGFLNDLNLTSSTYIELDNYLDGVVKGYLNHNYGWLSSIPTQDELDELADEIEGNYDLMLNDIKPRYEEVLRLGTVHTFRSKDTTKNEYGAENRTGKYYEPVVSSAQNEVKTTGENTTWGDDNTTLSREEDRVLSESAIKDFFKEVKEEIENYFIDFINIYATGDFEEEKQTYTQEQIDAINSGINASKVAQIETNKENIDTLGGAVDGIIEELGNVSGDITSLQNDKLDKVTSTAGDARVYGVNANGTQTLFTLDYSNTASAGRIPRRSSSGALMINDNTYDNPGQFEDGLQAVNKNKLLERTGFASSVKAGIVKLMAGLQLTDPATGGITTQQATDAMIEAKTDEYRVITSKNFAKALQVNNFVSNPNLLINGDFSINQRGEATYTGATNVYTVDRWKQYGATNTFTVATKTLTTALEFRGLIQYVENWESLKGKTITASLKATSGASGVRLAIKADDSTDLSYVDGLINSSGIISTTFTIPSDANYSKFQVALFNIDAEDTVLDWVKLEVGSVATPFSPRPYAEELAMCQRYYIGSTVQSNALRLNTPAFLATSATQVYMFVNLPVTMRTTPTLIINSNPTIRGSGINQTPTDISIYDYIKPEGIMIVVTTSGLTAYNAYALYNGYIQLDAEIY